MWHVSRWRRRCSGGGGGDQRVGAAAGRGGGVARRDARTRSTDNFQLLSTLNDRHTCITMLRAAVAFCCVLVVRGFLTDTISSAISVFLTGGTPHTVTELVDSKYLGRWYQVYASKSVALTFERNAFCVTADYGVAPDGRITVLNSDTLESVNGSLDVIHGFATKSSTVGQLTVNLETVPVPAPYWVIKLGPATFGEDGLYEYSVVTDSIKATLFVLARDVTVFRQQYQQEVLDFLTQEGFTNALNSPVETVHTDQCQYNAVPSSS